MNIPVQVSAAPHLPAGILSPYSDGERGAGRNLGALPEGVLLPVTIRGEVPGPPSAAAAQLLRRTGRAMRGSVTVSHFIELTEGRQS
ncbi:conserved hypothetical protein [Mesorhizobium metallidurans STM 2683]|uniref:Uncharacterized protein n=1 Tax=Mesorhizobium metallidurans STM 2683 TaxID=1297569 RepID=M5EVD6_9HYPH|nr:conserved hypothetical protein [Mesorhizobium metallidurans STM 2683]